MREVIGNQQARDLLVRAALGGAVSHAYLLTGPDQIGKTTLALAFARLLQCTARAPDDPEPCGACLACRKIAHGTHPDVRVLEPPEGKQWLPVEQVRDLLHTAYLAPYEGRWRIFILPQVERMRAESANALLKTLEEPPPGVMLLLTSGAPDLLLPTVISRCQVVPLAPLAPEEVARALVERWGAAPDDARTLAGLASGRLGWAVEALAQPERRDRRETLLRQIVELAGASRDARMRLASQLASDTEAARGAVELWALWWRDALLAAHGAGDLASTGAARAAAEQIGRAVGPVRAEVFMRRLLETRQQLDQNANPRLALEVLALEMPSGGPR
ncbi:MAG TPA: DNA polymerase III subunit delta' [Ktedonobacterales bacterium]|jgi:DNA polymerase-3 subunit delta'